MNIIGIIPARYASTRFPGKPLIDLGGKSMIQRVYEQCKKASSLSDVIVATDDERIVEHVQTFGGKVLMTGNHHQSGTDRCAEVTLSYKGGCDAVINIQGDEPFINPEQINALASAFQLPHTQLASMKKKLTHESDIQNPNMVKVVSNHAGDAIYFSRSPIPYRRNPEASITYYKHIGIYGYRKETLLEITQLPLGNLELAENLEQLRWIEKGYRITLVETAMDNIAIDTPEDVKQALAFLSLSRLD
ncbi:MAG: 3-deoxy-manno-octulosonate cytidylyltransferase [Bacteroidota bacterium]